MRASTYSIHILVTCNLIRVVIIKMYVIDQEAIRTWGNNPSPDFLVSVLVQLSGPRNGNGINDTSRHIRRDVSLGNLEISDLVVDTSDVLQGDRS